MTTSYVKKITVALVSLTVTLSQFFVAGFAFAETPTPPPVPLPQTSIFESLTAILEKILQILFILGGAAVVLLIGVAAFYFMTATASPVRREKAKQILIWTVVGYGVIVSARLIISIVANTLGGV